MNAFNKFKTQVAAGYDQKKNEINQKLAEQKEKRNKAIADSVSDCASAKSGGGRGNSNPYAQEGKVTFSLDTMDDFSHEELQSVVRRYDSKYKEARNSIKEQTEAQEKIEAALAAANEQLTDNQLMTDMHKQENQSLKDALTEQAKEIESLKQLCKVYEAEGEKNDELELKLENITQLLQKEKDLNASLVSQGQTEDGSSGAGAERVFQVKYEEECDANLKLKETINLLKGQKDQSVTQAGELAGENEKLTRENSEMKQRLDELEADHLKKSKLIESSKQRQLEMVQEKQDALDQVEALQKQLNENKGEREQVNIASDNQLSELMERIRGKDLVIDQNATELRQLKQKIQSQETSISFFKKKVDEVQALCDQERAEK